MNFPAMIYDLSTESEYYSSPRFKEVSDGLKPEDYWNPSLNFSKEILCDILKMARYIVHLSKVDKLYKLYKAA